MLHCYSNFISSLIKSHSAFDDACKVSLSASLEMVFSILSKFVLFFRKFGKIKKKLRKKFQRLSLPTNHY